MAVRFHIPAYLRTFTGGKREVALDLRPGTVREALEALWSVHPGVRDRVVNERGEVRQHVNVFLETENIRFLNGLETRYEDGAEVWIVPAVSGGSDGPPGRRSGRSRQRRSKVVSNQAR